MTTLAVALAEIALLKARVDALEAARGGAPSGAGSASAGGGGQVEPLADHQLSKSWADKVIAKDPKKWKGATQVGRKYSRAPVEWLEFMAAHYEFKAQKGREEDPVRCRNDGKPWHESDTFEAKLLRAWAIRNAKKAKDKPSEPADDFGGGFGGGPPVDDGGFGGGDDEIPF